MKSPSLFFLLVSLLSCTSQPAIKQVKIFYPSGKLSATGGMQDSLRHGKWTGFYETGEKESEGYYKKGNPTGKAYFYYPDGKIKRETDFKNGRIYKEISWYPNGLKQEEGYYSLEKFQRTGSWFYFDSTGKHCDTINHDKTPYQGKEIYFQF